MEQTGTVHNPLLLMVWTGLGVPYSPSWELAVLDSPGIASGDGDELKSCSEASRMQCCRMEAHRACVKGQHSGCWGRDKGRSTARGRKGPSSQNLPCLDRRELRKQFGRSPEGGLILNP